MDARLEADLLRWVDEYAKHRGWTRTLVLEEALRSFRQDVRGGVPDLPTRVDAVAREAEQRERSVTPANRPPQRPAPVDYAMERQRKLNEAKERGGR